MAHSSHRQWKGCRVCKPWKHRGNGDAARTPFRELRKVGQLKRINRHDVSTDR